MAPGSALLSLVADIEAMQTNVPDEYEGDAADRGWFGPFETGVSAYERGHFILWPNLEILLVQAKAALEATKPRGSAGPVESKASRLVDRLLE